MSVKPLLTQIRPTFFSVDCGMAYLIRLEDGSFALIDSTFGEYDEVDHIYSLLCKQNERGGKPVISAWFFTHPHDDHTNGFIRMARDYKDRVTVEKVIYNFPADMCERTHDHKGFLEAIDAYGAEVIIPGKGDVLRFGGAEFNVIFTSDDCSVRPLNVNETSLTMRMTLGNYSVMWLGDIQPVGSKIIMESYSPEQLKADIVQVGHHGYMGASDDFYRAIDPKIALWPVPEARYYDMLSDPWNRFFSDPENHVQHIFCGGIEETTIDMTAPIEITEPYSKTKSAVDFNIKSVYALNWACITGGGMGYGYATLSFGDGNCTLTAKELPTLVKTVQKGQAATAEKLDFSIELTPECDCETLGLIYDCSHPTDPNAYEYYSLPHKAGEKLSVTLKIDRTAGTAEITANEKQETLPLRTKKACDVILIMKNAKITVTKAEFENI